MNKNEENFKKAFDKIHPSEELLKNTIEKATKKKNTNKIFYLVPALATCVAAIVLVVNLGILKPKIEPEIIATKEETDVNNEVKEEIKLDDRLVRFASADELKEKIDELRKKEPRTNYFVDSNTEMALDAVDATGTASASAKSNAGEARTQSADEASSNYSTTNVQVEGVDEADIIKTDGKMIYTVSNGGLYVFDKELNLENNISLRDSKINIYFSEMYLTSDKIVLIGQKNEIQSNNEMRTYYTNNKRFTHVMVFDKDTLEEIRTVDVTGYNINSRLIGDNLYFITNESSYNFYYTDEDYETEYYTPKFSDSITGSEEKELAYTDISYFKGCKSISYTNVCSFNIADDEEVKIESLFGAGTDVYCSQNNLYLINTNYYYGDNDEIEIFKFKLDDGNAKVVAMAKLAGSIDSQFSIDEYDGNLRVATTEYRYNIFTGREKTINHLFVLNENMEIIGQTEDYARGERIYAVRFVGKVGYVVTFEQVDPLFVIDLSDPTNPVIKGELKVPGYSTYLHPYDETHIIGIGNNVEPNGHGGVHNTNMKMSMFDVSDLENPKELFTIDIGENNYVYSEIIYNHKALLYDKERNLIGFPLEDSHSGFVIYKINEDNFELFASNFERGYSDIERIIYIDDVVYALGYNKITSYDLNTMEEINKYEIKNNGYYERYYIDDVVE